MNRCLDVNLPPLLVRLMRCPATPPRCAFTSEMITALTEPSTGPEFILFDAVNFAEAATLYSVVRTIKPIHSAEIGFCCGGSGMAILQALADNANGATHHACDPFQASYAGNAGLRNVEAAGLSHLLSFRERFPEEVFPSLPKLQFAFIDASHLFDLSILDFVLVDKRLDVGGVLAFHDLWMPSLQKVVRFVLANRNYEIYQANESAASATRTNTSWKRALSRVLKSLPRARCLFSEELLSPWEQFGIGNMAFLRKTVDDTRDWRFHSPF